MLSQKAYENRLEYTRQWRKNNHDKVLATAKKRLVEGRSYESTKKYASKNPELVIKWRKKCYNNYIKKHSSEEISKKKHDYYLSHQEEIKERTKVYAKSHRIQISIRQLARRHSDPHRILRHNVSSAVRLKLLNHNGKKYNASIDKILPFKISDLMIRLESMFKPGMTWENYGKWHVDHIIPDCNFNYTTYNDPGFKQSWALTNLQPLWAKENLSKGNRINQD